MLSISARGSAETAMRYYEHLEADQEGQQRVDYYSAEGQGRFAGSGAETLGLSGPVGAEDFMQLAEGRTPLADAQNAGMENRRAGWDLTFSAPKSVSVLWALVDPATRDKIEAIHDLAVERAISFIERHAAFTRRGSGDLLTDEARRERVGLVAACYRHGTSRELDPQIHTHAFIFNVAPRADGTAGAIDSRPLFEWKMAGGAVYRAELAQALRSLGYSIERDGASFKITGVPQELCQQFSKRRIQIQEALAARGTHSAKASEVAALDTRVAKRQVSREALLEIWQQAAAAIAPGWRPEHAVHIEVGAFAPDRFNVTAAQEEMTRQTSTVSEARLYAQIAQERQIHGGVENVERSAAELKQDPATLNLVDTRGQVIYTTHSMRDLEHEMVDRAERMSRGLWHYISPPSVENAIAVRPLLSAEQIAAVHHVTQPGSLTCLAGIAGAGKSTLLDTARQAWEIEGHRVRGVSLSGKAAQELQKGSGIESATLKRLEMETRGWKDESGQFHPATNPLSSKDVIVLDEAGMVGSRQMAALLDDAEKAGCKLVLVGDPRQLQAIDAGAAFRAIVQRVGSARIEIIRRQQLAEDRQAVMDLAAGRANEALDNLSSRGRIHESDYAREAKEVMGVAIVRDLAADKLAIGMTGTRAEAQDVNQFARQAALSAGRLTGPSVPISTPHGEREFAVGDRVLFTRNNKGLDIKNGGLGTVRAIHAKENGQPLLVVQLDSGGGEREISTAEYDHLEHGYAVTVHKAQGTTVDRAHVLAAENGMSSREWAYVAASRHREEVHLYGDKHAFEDLAPAWSRARQKDTTLDYKPEEVPTMRMFERPETQAQRRLRAEKQRDLAALRKIITDTPPAKVFANGGTQTNIEPRTGLVYEARVDTMLRAKGYIPIWDPMDPDNANQEPTLRAWRAIHSQDKTREILSDGAGTFSASHDDDESLVLIVESLKAAGYKTAELAGTEDAVRRMTELCNERGIRVTNPLPGIPDMEGMGVPLVQPPQPPTAAPKKKVVKKKLTELVREIAMEMLPGQLPVVSPRPKDPTRHDSREDFDTQRQHPVFATREVADKNWPNIHISPRDKRGADQLALRLLIEHQTDPSRLRNADGSQYKCDGDLKAAIEKCYKGADEEMPPQIERFINGQEPQQIKTRAMEDTNEQTKRREIQLDLDQEPE